jgi:hypothetical protein
MHYAFLIFMMAFGAFLNRARGGAFDGLIPSDAIGRPLSMSGFALMNIFLFMPATSLGIAELFVGSTLLLWFWCCFGWDSLWGAAIGSGSTHSKLWGTAMMTLRMSLILPYYAFLVWFTGTPLWHMAYSATFLLMGVTYYISGRFTPGTNVIRNPELANGAIIGATAWLIGL